MCPAILVVDVVRVTEDLLLVARVPLQGELRPDRRTAGFGGQFGDNRDDFVVDGFLGLVQVLDEFANAALVLKSLSPPTVPLVRERNEKSRVEERQFSEPACEDVVLELGRRKDRRVGLERDLRSGLVRVADNGERPEGSPSAVLLEVDMPLSLDLHLEPLAHGIDGANTDAVQARADLVARVVELPPPVKNSHHDLARTDTSLL